MSKATSHIPLEQASEMALQQAKLMGASATEVAASHSTGLSVSARQGNTETIEHNNDKNLAVSVYFGQKKGLASTSAFSSDAISDAVKAACDIARHTEEDECLGLPDKALLATEFPDLSLFHPWQGGVERATNWVMTCEQASFDFSRHISHSEGATFASYQGNHVYANSHGFMASTKETSYSLSCTLIANDKKGMQRGYWYDVARDAADLESAHKIGQRAAQDTLRRRNAKKVKTGSYPVIFVADVACSLFRRLVNAIHGRALYQQSSFLLDHLGRQIFPDFIRIHEQPYLLKGIGSAAFDAEGVATRTRDIVCDGILQGYVLDSYSARKLAMATTANAGGVHNLTIDSGKLSFDDLLKQMGTGILVTETMGMGTNIVTGDYSQGAGGFWIEQGVIQYPIDEFTVASNLRDMFKGIQAVARDVDVRGNIRTGSVWIDKMKVAG